MAETRTDLANLALISIGEEIIENIDDDETDSARVIRLKINDTIKTAQSSYEWPELYAFMPLVDSGTLALDGMTKRWNLPTDLLQVRGIVPGSTNGPAYSYGVAWRIEDRFLVTAEAAPIAEYTKLDVSDIASWSPELVERVWTALAAEIAPLLTKSDAFANNANQRAQLAAANMQGRASKKKQSTLRRGRGQSWFTERRQRYDGYAYRGNLVARQGF